MLLTTTINIHVVQKMTFCDLGFQLATYSHDDYNAIGHAIFGGKYNAKCVLKVKH